MNCKTCSSIEERNDVPHVIRLCPGCGRELHIVDRGKHGIGIRIQSGDKFVIPDEWLKISLNPLQSSGRLFRAGLDMMARSLLLGKLSTKETAFESDMTILEADTDRIVNSYPPLQGLDINNPEHGEKIFTIMEQHSFTREYWVLWTGQFLAILREARRQNDITKATWAASCVERCRSMMIYKESLEEVLWMGQSVKRILDILSVWDANKLNSDEGFWQITFSENTYALSQVFAVPLVFIQDKAYVGGTKLDGSEARFVDYLFSAESSREAILIEIKTPATSLLGGTYRDHPTPSRELSVAIIQVLNYRLELLANLQTLMKRSDINISAFNPKCVIIVGNAEIQLTDPASRKAFELFRSNQRDVEIITYDELFRKIEILTQLFGLSRSPKKNEKPA